MSEKLTQPLNEPSTKRLSRDKHRLAGVLIAPVTSFKSPSEHAQITQKLEGLASP